MSGYVCIHGHFYQPPRENPWLEEIQRQEGAAPFHDWNERVSYECYEPNAASRILDDEKRVVSIVNNYTKMSFNFGPTLLSWLETHRSSVYRAVIDADIESRKLFSGHGAAIAQAYNHLIMPLADTRDRLTQIRWGIADFRYRFNRDPEGMWLPETAVDYETLEIMAAEGIVFTVLSPHQAVRVRAHGSEEWTDVQGSKIDTRRGYRCPLPSGNSIALFFYNGPIAHEVSFGDLLRDGKVFAERLVHSLAGSEEGALVHIATDGETYGHHHRFGDMALAYCIHHIESTGSARITVYGEYLEKFPPAYDVEILENTSWSCVHGIERWRSNCGCKTGKHPEYTQEWRAPLRIAMDRLRDRLSVFFETEGAVLLKNPWSARDRYISCILDRSQESIDRFFEINAKKSLTDDERMRALKLLEMERNLQLMFTSCGWFFEEISDIETIQVMQYAARSMQLARETGAGDLQPEYRHILTEAKSNLPEYDSGKDVYDSKVADTQIGLEDVCAHYAILSFFLDGTNLDGTSLDGTSLDGSGLDDNTSPDRVYCYRIQLLVHERYTQGGMKLLIGQARVVSILVMEQRSFCFGVFSSTNHEVECRVAGAVDDASFLKIRDSLESSMDKRSPEDVIRVMDRDIGEKVYTLNSLFADEQRDIIGRILTPAVRDIETELVKKYEEWYPLLQKLERLHSPVPNEIVLIGNLVIHAKLRALLESEKTNVKPLLDVIREIREFSYSVNEEVQLNLSRRLAVFIGEIPLLVKKRAGLQSLQKLDELVSEVFSLPFPVDIRHAQDAYFKICVEYRAKFAERARTGDRTAREMLAFFDSIGNHLFVRCN